MEAAVGADELRVRGALGNKAQQLSVRHGGSGAVDRRALRDGQADQHQHVAAPGGGDDLGQRLFGPVQQHPVPEQITAGGAGER